MKKKIFWLIFLSISLLMAGCWGEKDKSNPFDVPYNNSSNAGYHSVNTPELYGVGVGDTRDFKPAVPISITSSLYKIATDTGAATLIGDIGYYVIGIAYDSNKKKLYGIATNAVKGTLVIPSQLIEINMDTAKGKLIGDIVVTKEDYKVPPVVIAHSFSNPTFNSAGTLVAWNNTDGHICSIDLDDAKARCGEDVMKGADVVTEGELVSKNIVLSFNNFNVLYLIDELEVFTVNNEEEREFQGKLDKHLAVTNGDFNPVTGQFWGLYFNNVKGDDGVTGNLFVINIDERTLINTLSIPDNIQAITWVYDPI